MSKREILTDGREIGDRIYYGRLSHFVILNMSDEEIRKHVGLLQYEYATSFIDCKSNQMAYHRVLKALGLWKEHWTKCTCEQPP